MKVELKLTSQQLTKEELQHLLQSIRDCEQEFFKDKEISIWIEVLELTTEECSELLASIKPPFGWGFKIIGRG